MHTNTGWRPGRSFTIYYWSATRSVRWRCLKKDPPAARGGPVELSGVSSSVRHRSTVFGPFTLSLPYFLPLAFLFCFLPVATDRGRGFFVPFRTRNSSFGTTRASCLLRTREEDVYGSSLSTCVYYCTCVVLCGAVLVRVPFLLSACVLR
jgi:hypothetical protein